MKLLIVVAWTLFGVCFLAEVLSFFYLLAGVEGADIAMVGAAVGMFAFCYLGLWASAARRRIARDRSWI